MITKEEKTEAQVIHEIYKRLFKQASPSVDYDDLLKQNKVKKFGFGWFRKYYLDEDKQEKIVEDVCAEFGIQKWKVQAFKNEIALGHSPVGVKENWKCDEND